MKLFVVQLFVLASAAALVLSTSAFCAPEPLFELDARDSSAGAATWESRVGDAQFKKLGEPRRVPVNGIEAVVFGGQDAYTGPLAPDALTGSNPRTVELWVLNPSVNSPEETMVSWGKRGGPEGTAFSFNYGSSRQFGAATHWAADMGWDTLPEPGKWHHLVYTYDGRTARIYHNTAEQGSRQVRLNTTPGTAINLAVQNDENNQPMLVNVDRTFLAGSLAIAAVRIYADALTRDQIKARFEADAERFGAEAGKSFADLLANAPVVATKALTVKLVPGTQTVAALSPKGSDFDFTCGDRLKQKVGPGFYHLGDVTFETRTGSGEWKSFKTTTDPAAAKPLSEDAARPEVDLTATVGPDSPLSIRRSWHTENGSLTMRVVLKNTTGEPLEVGALGIAMPFNNDFNGRHLDDTHENCSFTDPYIGGDAGYLQVTRVNGVGPALLVLPEKGTSFEAYRPLRDDPTRRGVTFEGFYEWTVHSKAYAEDEWRNAKQWNTPTSRTLQPGEEITCGFTFVLSPTIPEIEKTLIANNRPVAVATPGCVLPSDQTGRLFLKYKSAVKSVTAVPANGVTITADPKPTKNGWAAYTLKGKETGWCHIEVTYADGLSQFIHYNVIPPMVEQVRRTAKFHQEKQWFTDTKDPFKRAYGYMGYDRKEDSMVMQDSRVWNAGLSDECGAGPNLLMAMKNLMTPDPAQVAQLEKYVDNVLWGNMQYKDNYGIKASLFYFQPDLLPGGYYDIRGGWDKARSETTWRAYNYPHQAAVYWTLYRLARNYSGLVNSHDWEWYLTQAYKTGLAMREHCGTDDFLFLSQYGLMDGTVFIEILKDLRREGWTEQADEYEAFMKERAAIWKSLKYPFGSEMPWDSTGQEEVYGWCKHFGYDDKAQVSLNAIVAYTPLVPNWAYAGSGRRYFDSMVYGMLPGIFRGCHHYGSSLNSIPILDTYRENPSDFYLLRTGYAAANGVLTNIDEDGHAAMLFAADPAVHDYDPFSGDYGCAFFGHAQNAGSYVYKHDEFGWLGFGCDATTAGSTVHIVPRDSFRKRVYIAPAGLYLTMESGTFEYVDYDTVSGKVTAALAPASKYAGKALLIASEPASSSAPAYRTVENYPVVRGAWSVELGKSTKKVVLQKKR